MTITGLLDIHTGSFYNLRMRLRSKIPAAGQIAQVFAVASLMIYGWTLYGFLDRLPSWLHYLNFIEILSNYSYAAVFNFVEVLLFIAGILALNLVLPRKFFMDRFVARGSLFAVLGLGYLIYLAVAVGRSKAFQFPAELFTLAPVVLLVLLAAALLLARVDTVRKATEDFADRAVIFLYILLPLSALGVIVFLVNNLF